VFGGLIDWLRFGRGVKGVADAVEKERKLNKYDWKITAKKAGITLGKVALGGAVTAIVGLASDPVAFTNLLLAAGAPAQVTAAVIALSAAAITAYNNYRKNKTS